MNAIEKLPEATAASIQASLLAVTIEDICRILFRHAIDRCQDVFGTSSGRTSLSIDYATWTITVAHDVDNKGQLSTSKRVVGCSSEEDELNLLSHLGLLHTSSTSSAETTFCIWQDGQKTRSALPSSALLTTPPPSNTVAVERGVTVCLRDVFSGMPVRRKFIASEALKKSQTDSLTHCVKELSLLVPDASIQLSVRHAPRLDGTTPSYKTLLSLPRAKDLMHRFQTVFGADSFDSDCIRTIASEHTFTSIRMKVDGFVCPIANTSAPQIIFMQGRVWPGATTRGGSHQLDRESAVFASLLSTFKLGWTDEPVQRHTRQASLSPDLYKQVC